MKERKRLKKRSITLIEIIVVMLLIATITGAMAYNYRDSLNQGKAFKTKEALARIETILNIAIMEQPDRTSDIGANWQNYIRQSPLVQNPTQYNNDGWGVPYIVTIENDPSGQSFAKVRSEGYEKYENQRRGSSTSQQSSTPSVSAAS